LIIQENQPGEPIPEHAMQKPSENFLNSPKKHYILHKITQVNTKTRAGRNIISIRRTFLDTNEHESTQISQMTLIF